MKNKDTIYIDIDDEITAIIDKVQNAGNKIVALVLPKRATVLQSIVNMKLLKRSAETAKKQVVLITSEAGLLPLAANVGLYVASTLQSKPAIPTTEEAGTDNMAEEIDEPLTLDDDFDTKTNATTPVGVLNGDEEPAVSTAEPESIDLSEVEDEAPAAAAPKTGKSKDKKKSVSPNGKKLAVPNFLRFRKRFILIVLALVVLIVGGFVGTRVLPKAAITIKADASAVVIDKTLTLSTQQQTVNSADGILPATLKQIDKKDSQQTVATGSKNIGPAATGKVTLTYCPTTYSLSTTVNTGETVSYNGKVFVVSVGGGKQVLYSGWGPGGVCQPNSNSSVTVSIKAVQGGKDYNGIDTDEWKYSTSSGIRAETANGGTTTGGADEIVTVVQQSDIDQAKQKLAAATSSSEAAKAELQQQLTAAGYQAIPETFTASAPGITTSANVNDQADAVTVTQTVTYKLFGVRPADLESLVIASAGEKIDTEKQSILNNGLDKATYSIVGTPADNSAQVKFRSEAMAGPKIDLEGLKTQLAGQKSGQIETQLKTLPGVEDVTVKFSPFWVTSVPKDASKVTVNFEQVGGGSDGQ